MTITRDLTLSNVKQPTVLTFGVFDGLHIGHQKIIGTVVARARTLGATATVLTFDPHPRLVLRPETAPSLLQTLEQRIEGLGQIGIEQVVVLPFTRELAATPAEEFLSDYIFGRLGALELYLGKGAAFGHNRQGRIGMAIEIAARLGRFVAEVEEVRLRGHRVSATMIRRLLKAGRINLARRMLGRPYEIEGHVVSGHGRGHELLVPTANLNSENAVIPASGVYVTLTLVDERWRRSITNIGTRPTFGDSSDQTIETHFLGVHEEVLGRRLRLRFLRRLREEKRFATVEDLRQQILRDSARAKRYFNHSIVHQCLTFS
jgi:riboflavin kinase/FMN adenylyltransferase